MEIAGLMDVPKFKHNVLRAGDVKTNAPSTILEGSSGVVIRLPMPLNLNSSISTDWQQQEVSVAGYALKHAGVSAGSFFDKVSKMGATAALENIWDASKVMEGLGNDAKSLMARSKESNSQVNGIKMALNPRMEMLFKGINFKSFQFQFMLVPLSQKDSEDIAEAVFQIQKACVPDLQFGKMFMSWPDTWNIRFESSEKYIMSINECCCTNIGINYTPNAQSSTMHPDNAPLAVELSLDFTEILISTKDNIDEYNG